MVQKKRTRRLAVSGWIVVCLVALSYLLAFMQRTGPGVIADQLQTEFRVSSAALGAMTSIQYLLYMVLQIPVGLFGDRFGPEKLLVSGVLLDGAGTLLFAHSHGFIVLLMGRAIVGLGDALIWVNIVLILGRRFAPKVFGSLLGLVGTAGNVGALLTTLPFAAWTASQGWRIPFTILGGLLIFIAIMDWLVLRQGAHHEYQQFEPHVSTVRVPSRETLLSILRNRTAWAVFACHFGACGTFIGFFSLWAVPYFLAVYTTSRSGATFFTLAAFIGAAAGGPIVGTISDRLGSRRKPYIFLQLIVTVAWAMIPICMGHPPAWLAWVLMFVIGFVCGGSLLTFAVIRDQIPVERVGVASGFANTGGFLSAVLLPVLFGGIIDWLAPTTALGQVSSHVFIVAFLVPTLFSLIGLFGSLAIVEKQVMEVQIFS